MVALDGEIEGGKKFIKTLLLPKSERKSLTVEDTMATENRY